MHEHRPDALVAIGGGSTMDMAKAARLEFGQGEPFERFTRFEVAVTEPALPLVTVPTTSGTGSEVSGGAVVTVGTRKRGAAHPLMRAQHALVDPLLTLDLPTAPTRDCGVDALAQAIGGVIVRNGNPGSIALGLEACRYLADGLPAAVADGHDRAARAQTSLGSLMAGLSMNLSDCGADHALGHALGGLAHLPHGLTVGLFLAEALDTNRRVCARRARASGRRPRRARRWQRRRHASRKRGATDPGRGGVSDLQLARVGQRADRRDGAGRAG